LKKEWWTVRAPGLFQERNFTISPVNVTAGERLSSDNMKGRVYTVSLGDLNHTAPHKKMKLIVDEEQEKGNKVALTNFYGLDTTRDHLCSLIKKWHSLIECFVDAKTSDGFLLRLFVTCSTRKAQRQQRATSYAQVSQVKQIRKIMHSTVLREVKKATLRELVPKLMTDTISQEITKKASTIYPVQNCIIRKVKSVKRPRFDMTQLLNMHVEQAVRVGAENTVVAESSSEPSKVVL
jgi:small subunit ribosomal protein S3Ae